MCHDNIYEMQWSHNADVVENALLPINLVPFPLVIQLYIFLNINLVLGYKNALL